MILYSLWGAVLASAAGPPVHPLVQVFVSACVDGEVKFHPRAAHPVHFEDLPPVLKHAYGKSWPDSVYYEITVPARAYLLIMRDKDNKQRSTFSEICAVAAPNLPYDRGYDQVMQLTTSQVLQRQRSNPIMLEFYNAQRGYVLAARQLSSGWVMLKLARTREGYKPPFPENHPAVTTKRLPAKNKAGSN